MAGLLQFSGSDIPESIRAAAQKALDGRNAKSAPTELKYKGSQVPDRVRLAAQGYLASQEPVSMQQARDAAKAASARTVSQAGWSEGSKNLKLPNVDVKGLLGKGAGALGRAAGPLGAAYTAGEALYENLGPPRVQAIQTAIEEGQTREAMQEDPGLAGRGAASAYNVASRAAGGVLGLMDQGEELNESRGVKITRPGADVEGLMIPMAASKKPLPGYDLEAEAIPMEPAKQNQVDKAAEANPQVEQARTRIEQGTLQGLQSGEVHVSDLAKGVVQADAQRAGKELKDDEVKTAVQAEVVAMKTMNQDQLAKYVSYAMIAGGLLASVVDKSGTAGQYFHESMNKQLDRNLEAGAMSYKATQAAAKLALDERKVDVSEKDVDSKVDDREFNQGATTRRLEQGDTGLGIKQTQAETARFSANTQASQGAARLGLMGQSNDLKARDIESKIAARTAKMAESTKKGVAPSVKDATGLATDYLKGQGLSPDPAVVSALGSRIPTIMKNYPELSAVQALEIAQDELGDSVITEDNMIFTNKTRFRKPKDK